MSAKLDDPQVSAAIELLKSKGVTLDQITQVYKHYYAELPTPGSRIQWNHYSIATVLENHSNIYPTAKGYIRIKNAVGTELYLLPHEYRVMRVRATDTTESPSEAAAE